jgi:predicted GH43/DUF377 family glycosyl hydrolase
MRYADTSRGRPFAKDPIVVWFRDRYWMYYSIPPYGDSRANDGWAIGIATSDNLDDWRRVGEILPAHEYERNGLCAPGALVRDGQLHLFYQTYGNGANDSICHASSADGIHFERNPTNPIFQPSGPWTCGRAIDADVVVFQDHVLLYYATRDPAMQIQMLGVAATPTTTNFAREEWSQWCDAPILSPALPWEQTCSEAPAVCRRGDQLVMFYAGAYNNRPQQIGCAVSSDGRQWQRLFDQPLLPNGPAGAWNASESGHPSIFVDRDGRTYLFFQGNNDQGRTWYLSKVEVGWRGTEPVLLTAP